MSRNFKAPMYSGAGPKALPAAPKAPMPMSGPKAMPQAPVQTTGFMRPGVRR